MTSNVGCWKRRLAVLAIATSLLSGCGTLGFEPGVAAVCPPVVEYSRELQTRAADELGLLPGGSAIAEMLSDYAVMRAQARFCVAASSPLSGVGPARPHIAATGRIELPRHVPNIAS